MTALSLDTIIRNCLLRKNYSMHWYIDALVAAKDCLRELTIDDLQVINTQKIPVDANTYAADVPSDMVGWPVRVSIQSGQFLRVLVPTNNINPLVYRVNGVPSLYTDTNNPTQSIILNNLAAGYFWRTITWNQFGENVGRLFGFNVGYYNDIYQYFPERRQIQLSESSGISEIVVEYISNGMTSDAATRIDWLAHSTIDQYIMWQFKEQNRSYSLAEKERERMLYLKERSILRSRKAEWSIPKILRIVQKATYGAPKQ